MICWINPAIVFSTSAGMTVSVSNPTEDSLTEKPNGEVSPSWGMLAAACGSNTDTKRDAKASVPWGLHNPMNCASLVQFAQRAGNVRHVGQLVIASTKGRQCLDQVLLGNVRAKDRVLVGGSHVDIHLVALAEHYLHDLLRPRNLLLAELPFMPIDSCTPRRPSICIGSMS